jgi:hypothetical protein
MYFRGVIAGSTLAGNMSGGFVPFPIIFSKR